MEPGPQTALFPDGVPIDDAMEIAHSADSLARTQRRLMFAEAQTSAAEQERITGLTLDSADAHPSMPVWMTDRQRAALDALARRNVAGDTDTAPELATVGQQLMDKANESMTKHLLQFSRGAETVEDRPSMREQGALMFEAARRSLSEADDDRYQQAIASYRDEGQSRAGLMGLLLSTIGAEGTLKERREARAQFAKAWGDGSDTILKAISESEAKGHIPAWSQKAGVEAALAYADGAYDPMRAEAFRNAMRIEKLAPDEALPEYHASRLAATGAAAMAGGWSVVEAGLGAGHEGVGATLRIVAASDNPETWIRQARYEPFGDAGDSESANFDAVASRLMSVIASTTVPPSIQWFASQRMQMLMDWGQANRSGAMVRFEENFRHGFTKAAGELLLTPLTVAKYGAWIGAYINKRFGSKTLAELDQAAGDAIDAPSAWWSRKVAESSGQTMFDPASLRGGIADAGSLGQIAGEIGLIIATGGVTGGRALAREAALAVKSETLAGSAMSVALAGIAYTLPHLPRFVEANRQAMIQNLIASGAPEAEARDAALIYSIPSGVADVLLTGFQFGIGGLKLPIGFYRNILTRAIANTMLSAGTGGVSQFALSMTHAAIESAAAASADQPARFMERLVGDEAIGHHVDAAIVGAGLGAIFGLAHSPGVLPDTRALARFMREQANGKPVPSLTESKVTIESVRANAEATIARIEKEIGQPLPDASRKAIMAAAERIIQLHGAAQPDAEQPAAPAQADTKPGQAPQKYATVTERLPVKITKSGAQFPPDPSDVVAWIKANPEAARHVASLPHLGVDMARAYTGLSEKASPTMRRRIHRAIVDGYAGLAEAMADSLAKNPNVEMLAHAVEELEKHIAANTDPDRGARPASPKRVSALEQRLAALKDALANARMPNGMTGTHAQAAATPVQTPVVPERVAPAPADTAAANEVIDRIAKARTSMADALAEPVAKTKPKKKKAASEEPASTPEPVKANAEPVAEQQAAEAAPPAEAAPAPEAAPKVTDEGAQAVVAEVLRPSKPKEAAPAADEAPAPEKKGKRGKKGPKAGAVAEEKANTPQATEPTQQAKSKPPTMAENLMVAIGIQGADPALVAAGFSVPKQRTIDAVSDLTVRLGLTPVIYDGPGADRFAAFVTSHEGTPGIVVVSKSHAGAALMRTAIIHEVFDRMWESNPAAADAMVDAISEVVPGLVNAITSRYRAAIELRLGAEKAADYEASGRLRREVLSVLAHNIINDIGMISPGGKTITPSSKGSMGKSLFVHSLSEPFKRILHAAAGMTGAKPGEKGDGYEAFVGLVSQMASQVDPTNTARKIAAVYRHKVEPDTLKTIHGTLLALLEFWKMRADVATAIKEIEASNPPLGRDAAVQAAGKLGTSYLNAAEVYFEGKEGHGHRSLLLSLLDDANFGDTDALNTIDILRRTIRENPLEASHFGDLARAWVLEQTTPVDPKVKTLLTDWGVGLPEGDIPFLMPGMTPTGLVERVMDFFRQNRASAALARSVAVPARRKDISPIDAWLTNRMILAMRADPTVRKVMVGIAMLDMAATNDRTTRLDSMHAAVHRVPRKLHPELAKALDEYYNPAERHIDPRWAALEKAHGVEFADALVALKHSAEIMRLELIAGKRGDIIDYIGSKPVRKIVEWGRKNGSPELRFVWSTVGPHRFGMVVDVLRGSVVPDHDVLARVVTQAVPDDWGRQWAHFHHRFVGNIAVSYKGAQIGVGRTVEEARHIAAKHARTLSAPPSALDYDVVASLPFEDGILKLTPSARANLANTISGSAGVARTAVREAIMSKVAPDIAGSSWYAAGQGRLENASGWSHDLVPILRHTISQHTRWLHWRQARKTVAHEVEVLKRDGLTRAASVIEDMVDAATGMSSRGWFEEAMNTITRGFIRWTVDAPARVLRKAGFDAKLLVDPDDPYVYRAVVAGIKAANTIRFLWRPAQVALNRTQPIVYGLAFLSHAELVKGIGFYNSARGQAFIKTHGFVRPEHDYSESLASLAPIIHAARRFMHNQKFSVIGEWANHDLALATGYHAALGRGLPHDLALAAAYQHTMLTQFTHLPSTQAPAFKGPTMGVLFQFKSFLVNSVTLMHGIARSGEGPFGKMTPGERIGGLAKVIAGIGVLGGVRGASLAPIAFLAWASVAELFRGEDIDPDGRGAEAAVGEAVENAIKYLAGEKVSEKWRTRIRNVVERGVPTLMGWDMSGQVMLLPEPVGKSTLDRAVNFLTGPTLGSLVNMGLDTARAQRSGLETGTARSTIETALSTLYRTSAAARSIGDATDILGDVFAGRSPQIVRRDSTGRPKVVIEGMEALVAAFGGRTMTETQYAEVMNVGVAATATANLVVARAARLILDGDIEGSRKVIDAWNGGVPLSAAILPSQVMDAMVSMAEKDNRSPISGVSRNRIARGIIDEALPGARLDLDPIGASEYPPPRK